MAALWLHEPYGAAVTVVWTILALLLLLIVVGVRRVTRDRDRQAHDRFPPP